MPPYERNVGADAGFAEMPRPDQAADPSLVFLEAMEAGLRGQILHLESLALHGAVIERALCDDTGPVLQAARSIACSITNIQRILDGNLSLIHEVRRIHIQHVASPETPVDGTSSADSLQLASSEPSSRQNSNVTPGTDSLAGASNEQEELLIDLYDCTPTPQSPSTLHYHSDVTGLQGTGLKLFEPSHPADEHPSARSRRVVLGNLPPGASAAQVLRGIDQRIKSVIMLPPALSNGDTQTGCLIEFVDPDTASQFARGVSSRDLLFEGARGDVFCATAWLIPSPSFQHGLHESQVLDAGQTRTLVVKYLPDNAVWYFLCMAGVKEIVDVRRAGPAELVVEFATVRAAERTVRLRKTGAFTAFCSTGRPLAVHVVCDTYARGARGQAARGAIGYVPSDPVAELWNREPFNSFWPGTGDTQQQDLPASGANCGAAAKESQVNREVVVKAEGVKCAWEEYACLARQRRENAGGARLSEGDMAWRGGIKDAGVPAIVSRYLDTSRVTVVDTSAC